MRCFLMLILNLNFKKIIITVFEKNYDFKFKFKISAKK